MCSRCRVDKSNDDYYFTKGKRHSWCKECVKTHTKRTRLKAPTKYFLKNIRSKCKRENLPFDLTEEYLDAIWTDYCPISGQLFDLNDCRKRNGAQLDRKNPELGYIQGNVVFISARMNRIKDNATIEELRAILQWLEKQES